MTTQPISPQLDPRRYFTAAEVTAAWLLQDRRCRECNRDVPRDLVEGDHIIAWSAGGPTTMENLQVLCIACNRRKGIREGVVEGKTLAAVAMGTAPLRRWQERALEATLKTFSPVLIDACPGAGKTRFALEYAARLFLEHVVNRVLIVVPTVRVADQWIEAGSGAGGAAAVPLAPAGWRPTQPLFQRWAGGVFTYHALFAQTTMFEALAAEPGFKTLVIFDEIHPAGADSAWGIAAQQAFMAAATRILSLSGTAFRTRDPIVFIQTREGKSVADYTYSYGDALADGVCRPLRFAAIGGTATFRTPGGGIETVSFDDDLNEQGESYRLRTVLAPDGDHLREMLRTADEELTRLRTTTDPDARRTGGVHRLRPRRCRGTDPQGGDGDPADRGVQPSQRSGRSLTASRDRGLRQGHLGMDRVGAHDQRGCGHPPPAGTRPRHQHRHRAELPADHRPDRPHRSEQRG